jgi:hypothetical protein
LTSGRPLDTQDSATRFRVGGRNAPGGGKDAPPTPKAAGERISRTTVKRVRWSGPNPRVGQALVLRGKLRAWLIRRVLVIRNAKPHQPRLDLTVSSVLVRDLPDSVRRYDWSRTDKPPRPPPPQPRPPLDPNRPKPTTLAEQSLAAARRAKGIRLAAEAAPPFRADESRWDDPEDAVQTRTPKQVKGHRRGDQVGRLYRTNGDVTRDMLLGANAFRCQYDIALYGLTDGDPLADRVGGSTPGPVVGPRRTETERAAAERDIIRLFRLLGRQQTEMLVHVVANDGTIPQWARDHAPEGKSNSDRDKRALGFLCAVLARVAEYYGLDERRDRAEGRRAL